MRRLPPSSRRLLKWPSERHVGVGRVAGVLLAADRVVGFLAAPSSARYVRKHHDLKAPALGGESR